MKAKHDGNQRQGQQLEQEIEFQRMMQRAMDLRQQFGNDVEAEDHLPRTFGGYELIRCIGEGGMGRVYQARQDSTQRQVALKVIRPDLVKSWAISGTKAIQRFEQEIKAAANLSHPNIVTVFDAGIVEDHHYFSMAYVDGRNLAEVLEEGNLDSDRAVRLMRSIVDAVHCAHEAGMLHRDLKPENILVDENDHPYVADFGLAKQIGDADQALTQTGTLLGTLTYMSPEQAQDARCVTRQSDIYSLGAMLYAMLTSEPPLTAENQYEFTRRLVEREPEPLIKRNPKLSVDLNTVCMKCLEKNPVNRYADCGQLRDDLDRIIGNRPVVARPISWGERGLRWARRNPVLVVAGTAMLITAYAWISYWSALHSNRKAMVDTIVAADSNQIESAVDKIKSNNHGRQLTSEIENQLRQHHDNQSKINLLFALSRLSSLNDDHIGQVIELIAVCGNDQLVIATSALSDVDPDELKARFDELSQPGNAEAEAKLALSALLLDHAELAMKAVQIDEDQTERAKLIDLMTAVQLDKPSYDTLLNQTEPELISAILVGLANNRFSGGQLEFVESLYQSPDQSNLVSSGAWYFLNQHGIRPLANLETSENRFVHPIGIEFIRIPSGKLTTDETEPREIENSSPFFATRLEVSRDVIIQLFEDDQDVQIPTTSLNRFHDPLVAGNYLTVIEAMKICNRLSKMSDLTPCYLLGQQEDGVMFEINPDADGYSLPTPQQWEWMARCRTISPYYFAKDPDVSDVKKHGWFYDNRPDDNDYLSRGGLKRPNGFGLFDLYGNVTEFVLEGKACYWMGGSASTKPLRYNSFKKSKLEGINTRFATYGLRVVLNCKD